MDEKILEKLEERIKKKKRKPNYLRTDWYKKSRLGRRRKKKQKWRRPKGRHNKIRERRKGKPKRPEVGYGSPKEVKHSIKGLFPVHIYKIDDLYKINKDREIAIISGNLGLKKKIEILKKAKELDIKTNIDIDKFLKEAEEIIKKRKEERKEYEEKLRKKEEKTKVKEVKEEEKKKEEIEKEIKKEKEEIKKIVETKKEKISKEKHVETFRMALEK
ncbi:MAG: eL32 family ribosomal protein [Candidatus Pacearchaeota archaeon]